MVVQLNNRLSFLVAFGSLGTLLFFAPIGQPYSPEEVICRLTPAVVVIQSDCSLTTMTVVVASVMSVMRTWLPVKSTPPPLVGPPPAPATGSRALGSIRVSLKPGMMLATVALLTAPLIPV